MIPIRAFAQASRLLALSLLPTILLTAAVGAAAVRPAQFASMEQVFDAPRGACFGVDANGVALNTNTFYRATTPGLIFDAGSNQIFAPSTVRV